MVGPRHGEFRALRAAARRAAQRLAEEGRPFGGLRRDPRARRRKALRDACARPSPISTSSSRPRPAPREQMKRVFGPDEAACARRRLARAARAGRRHPVRARADRARQRRDLARRRHRHLPGRSALLLPQPRPGGAARRLRVVQGRGRRAAVRGRAPLAAGTARDGGVLLRLRRGGARGRLIFLPDKRPMMVRNMRDIFHRLGTHRAGRPHAARRHSGPCRRATIEEVLNRVVL